ncbi:MAG: hypothetical protein M1819_001875 [Sarea resinae]|nr:MAG: hypothetical protein M1819_001875 [Sarea resinae]
MSFMSAFGAPPKAATMDLPTSNPQPLRKEARSFSAQAAAPVRDSPTPPRTRERAPSRPMSMVQTYQPPLMDVAQDTLPELQPIFTFLNSHSNKLYQEGYFLKFNDLDTNGNPTRGPEHAWKEYFAQLVGTILSLWDADALDAAGQDGEVLPTFINLSDASIKMIKEIPSESGALENVLSISTAGKNRYLFHFNSYNSLTQWTAGIRLAMFEQATLQEAYTGALIAGKGKMLNNIRVIMERSKLKTEDWVRVRFGAGTPWRRCWCVITPPDEKEFQKHQKALRKRSAYDRSSLVPKGDVKFYDAKKITKKTKPIASISNAYSAYAIYPQSKALIDHSTLVKVEGTIQIYNPESTTEGFVFVMPEIHPAVSGFEMMLRWLFPVFDTFGLYGRPIRLVADTLDVRSLMFAMPKERRYGYLELLDVAGLIHTDGSSEWTDREWRKRMKELTSRRMTAFQSATSRVGSTRIARRSTTRNSRTANLKFDDGSSIRSSPSMRQSQAISASEDSLVMGPRRTDSAPASGLPYTVHQRSVSEAQGFRRYQSEMPSRLSHEATLPRLEDGDEGPPPPPPPHAVAVRGQADYDDRSSPVPGNSERSSEQSSLEADQKKDTTTTDIYELQPTSPVGPVASPPAFSHGPGAKMPPSKLYHSPELRNANSRMSTATLAQMRSGGDLAANSAAAAWRASPDGLRSAGDEGNGYSGAEGTRGVFKTADATIERMTADQTKTEGLVTPRDRQANSVSQMTPDSRSRNMPPQYSSIAKASAREALQTGQQRGQSNQNVSSSTAPWLGTQVSSDPITYAPLDTRQESNGRIPYTNSDVPRPSNDPATSPNQAPGRSDQQPIPLASGQSILRKPVPVRSQPLQPIDADGSERTSSLGSLQDHVFDPEALDKVIARIPSRPSDDDDDDDAFKIHRQPSEASSAYDTGTPDYASTVESKHSVASVEKPRAGVLRTVGAVEPVQKEIVVGDAHYTADSPKQAVLADIPDVDFGPTLAYRTGNNSRPGSSMTLTQPTYDKLEDNATEGRLPGVSGESKRNSFVRPSSSSPRPETQGRSNSRPASRHLKTPELLENEDDGRSIAWSPGMAARHSPRPSLSPEQFVQQRAAVASQYVTPIYAHQRTPSGNVLRSGTPPSRSTSGDWSALLNRNKELPSRPHSRGASPVLSTGLAGRSYESLPRPHSRGASTVLSTGLPYDASHLSAREQEHISRVTGSPLINLAGQHARASSSGGLVGAIEAREIEKKQIKEGFGGQAVQHAIMMRQQQAQAEAQARALQQQQVFPSPPMYSQVAGQQIYGPGGQFPPDYMHASSASFAAQQPGQYQQPQDQRWVSPQAQIYAQGGGWDAAGSGYHYPQYQQQHPGGYYGNGQQGPQQGPTY